MEKREQDILKKIEEKAKDTKVPESLSPERIEKLLEEKGRKHGAQRAGIYRIGGILAACAVLAVCIGIAGNVQKGGYLGGTPDTAAEIAGEASADMEAGDTDGAGNGSGATSGTSDGETADNGKQDDYKKVYSYIKAKLDRQKREAAKYEGLESGAVSDGAAGGTSAMQKESTAVDMASNAADTGSGGGSGYSETNVRQKGVDEGDIVKTDGRYLYVLKEDGGKISIVDTKGGLKEAGEIKAEDNQQIQEIYVVPGQDKLVYIAGVYETEPLTKEESTESEADASDQEYIFLEKRSGAALEKTEAVTCDIKDPKKPKKLGKVSQSGYYTSSRIAGGHLYLFTRYSVGDNIVGNQPRTFIPMVNGGLIREKDISLPPFKCGSMYEVVTAISLKAPSKATDSKAIFTDGGELYVSNENIYYYETKWSDSGKSDKTVIRRIGYKDGKLQAAAQGSIKGYINDSFSIDEYKGNLRIVATVGETNSVYVLDGKLKTIGSIKKLAKDERVYSARLLGDTGYFVTFRETDPLFSVDLSDPKNPKILGKLKIPGFSDYLHFYGKDKLLGIGMNVDGEAMVTDGVKLSMFDISDNTDVKEENKLVLKNVYSTDVSYDYKAALIDVEKNMIGFAGSTEGGDRYYLFSYDEKTGFKCNMSEEINGRSFKAARGVYISDTLYVVSGNVIEAYSLKDYRKTEDLIL